MLGTLVQIPAIMAGKAPSVKTDNFVFRLHYQVTSIIFLTASTILVSNQLLGEPIKCFNHESHQVEDNFAKTVETICWVTSTFTVKEHLCAKLDREVPYAGIGILTPAHTPFNIQVTYRFLFFMFFLQGLSFLMPHFIWRSWESQKMKMLSAGLEDPLLDDHRKSAILRSLTNYLLRGDMNGSIKYAFYLHFCELMNLVTVGINIWVMDVLFRKEFIGYGLTAIADVFRGSSYAFDTGCDDPIKALFPQMAKCSLKSFGPSGSLVVKDNLCVLPLNEFNSNFFKFIWIWFAILLTLSVFWLLLRVLSFYSAKIRSLLLMRRAGRLPVSTLHMHDGASCCSRISSRVSYADWVILMQLGSNMDPLTYKLFLESFCHQTEIKENGNSTKMIDKIYYSPV